MFADSSRESGGRRRAAFFFDSTHAFFHLFHPLFPGRPHLSLIHIFQSDAKVDDSFVGIHVKIGVDSLNQLINQGLTVKHLKF